MRLAKGDMWSVMGRADLFCITTNAQTRGDGALVMGRGIAAQAKQRDPKLPYLAGKRLKDGGLVGKEYGLMIIRNSLLSSPVGLFQVKYHWKDEADPHLISLSVAALCAWCANFEHGLTGWGYAPYVHLNFPGIGNGRLRRDAVLPLLTPLPDCVTVWEYE